MELFISGTDKIWVRFPIVALRKFKIMEDLTGPKIKELIVLHELMIEEIEQKSSDEIRSFRKRISHLRSLCKHEQTTYHPDPSGNNDSCYTCDSCGLEKRRF